MNQKTLILLICLFAISYQHGVHRVAQSAWNYPNFGSTTKLYLYFSLDEALPAGGLMNIVLPSDMTQFVPTSCNAWALTTDMTPPATTSGFLIGRFVNSPGTGCQFYSSITTPAAAATTNPTVAAVTEVLGAAVALSANTAYGLELLDADCTTLPVGSYAPISITTRSGVDSTAVTTGPLLASNPVFDMVFVQAGPLTVSTGTTRVANADGCVGTACNGAKTRPGDAYNAIFTLSSWSDATTSTVIPAPYNIEFSFVAKADNAGYVYGTWSFAASSTSCDSTQFGPALTNGTIPTMSVTKPECTYAANAAGTFVKTIKVTAEADDMRPVDGAWSTWVVSFTMEVTNPSDLIEHNPDLVTRIYNPLNNQLYAYSSDSTTVFKVSVTARTNDVFDTANDANVRVAFGANPMTSTGHLYGAGVYSEMFCVGSKEYNPGKAASPTEISVVTLPSNCAQRGPESVTSSGYDGAGPQPARSVNAIELAWTIPIAIPGDSTSSVVTCNIDTAKIDTNNANNRFFKIHQASLATDVASGNCWYSSTNSATTNFWQRELITCKDMVAVAANAVLTVAFQFEIFQTPYIAYENSYADDDAGQVALTTAVGHNKVWNNARVDKTITTLTCQMIVTAGGQAWYTHSILIPVDGSTTVGAAGDFASYQTFIVQSPADEITMAKITGLWTVKTNYGAGSLTHTWQVEPATGSSSSTGGEFSKLRSTTQDLTIALMFYTGDVYTDDSSVDWADVGGRRIPMPINAAMHLNFYLYGQYTFTSSNKLKAEWQGYGTAGSSGTSALLSLYKWNLSGDYANTAFFFGTTSTSAADSNGNQVVSDTSEGGLDVCAADIAYDASSGLCATESSFTPITVAEGGKVLIHSTTKAGGHVTGATNSPFLMKACVTNGGGSANAKAPLSSATGYETLVNMFQSCKFTAANYMSFWDAGLSVAAAANVALSSNKAFYVMMAGAFQNTREHRTTVSGQTSTVNDPSEGGNYGFVSPNFEADGSGSTAYGGANYATYHKFKYTAAYAGSSTTRMTTFRGRGGMGSSAHQGLETFFWSVKENGTGSGSSWVIATMIHTYIAHESATQVTYDNSKVLVSWPAWPECYTAATNNAASTNNDQNDGLLFFNTMKITIQQDYSAAAGFATQNTFLGTFVPRGQAFMKSGGNNQIEVVSTDSTTACYIYGSQSGRGYQVYNVGAGKIGNGNSVASTAGNVRIFKHGYDLGGQLDSNFVVCSVSATTAAGVVTVIPFTNTYAAELAIVLTSEFVVLVSDDWKWAIALVVGSDRNLFEVGFYAEQEAIVADANYVSETSGTSQFFTTDATVKVLTTETTASDHAFNIEGVENSGNDYIIGASGVVSKMSVTVVSGGGQNWLTGAVDLAQICGDPTYLMGANTGDVYSGASVPSVAPTTGGTGANCIKKTLNVRISDTDVISSTEAQATVTPRECWYCPQLAAANQAWIITGFQVPVTSTRKISGFTLQISVVTGAVHTNNIAPETETTTLTKIGTITECSATPTSLNYNVKGSTVAWSVTSPTPLAGLWVIKFVAEVGAVTHFKVSPVANSVTTDCANTVITQSGDFTSDTSTNSVIAFTLPAAPTDTLHTPALPTYGAICAGGSKFTATVNNWKPSAAATAFTDGKCVITIAPVSSADSIDTEVGGLTANDQYLGAISMSSSTLSFDQNTAGTASDLSIIGQSFSPKVGGSYGRLQFRPVLGASTKLYAGQSVFAYTFGSYTFNAGSACKITDSTFTTQSSVVSSCAASSSIVTIKMGTDAATVAFGVEIYGVTGSWTTAQTITTDLKNFADTVQSTPATAVTLAALPAAKTHTTVLTLTKTYVNTMDLGTFMFTPTLTATNGTFNSSQWALIQFPTYYRPDLGAGVLCNVNFNGTTTEAVWCELQWDWTLKVWGPIANPVGIVDAAGDYVYKPQFNISVMGVDNVNPSAARDFQVSFSNMSANEDGVSLTLADDDCFQEYKTVTDTVVAAGWAAAKTSLKVWEYTAGSTTTRGTTQVKIVFQVPTTTLATISDITLGYVTLHLPHSWGAVIQSGASLTTKLEEAATTTPFALTAIGATTPADFSGCSVTVWMTGTTNKWVQGTNYTLTIGGIPTSQAAVANIGLLYPVISVGKQTTGALGWSDSANWATTAAPTAFALGTGLSELQFSAMSYTVNQGTYSAATAQLCIQPTGTGAKFNSDISFAIDGTTFVTAPATLSAKQGDLNTCAAIGTAATTALSWYWVTFTATSTASKYTPLPYLKVQVQNTKGVVSNVAEASCTLGYSSVPIRVYYDVAPFSDITVTLNAKALVQANLSADNTTNNPSYGLTANTGATSVTLTQLVPSGILSFTCADTLNSSVDTALWYNITGTDQASFTLQNAAVKAKDFTARGDKLTSAVVYLAQENTTSSAAMLSLKAGCPQVGTAYVWFAPSGTAKPSAADAAAVKSLADAFATSTEAAGYDSTVAHLSAQWASVPVLTTNSPPTTTDYVDATFHTVSNKTYTAMAYCASSNEYFYESANETSLQALDNGGKVSNIELTYTQYFDEALHNTDLLKVAGAMATGVMIANDRVSDRWGGIFGSPSAFVPTTAFTPQTATTVTNTTNTTNATNTTTTAATTTTDATATTTTRLLTTSYPVNLFIQPDPTAATALDSTAWTAAVNGIKTQIEAAVTTYGTVATITASAAAPSISEAEVSFSTDPAATSSADGTSVAVAGAVAGDSYVYCAFQKVGTAAATTTRRILQDATTTDTTANTTAATTTDTTANTTAATTTTTAATTTTTAAVATSMLSWSSADWVSGYSFSRSTTTTAVPAWTQSFNTTAGSTYKWACQATSLNPVAANAQFMSAYKEGSVTATVPVAVGAGSLFSTIAAISFIIIAAFFY